MALDAAQKTLTAEIVRESYAAVESKASSLNAAQESLLSDDLDVWEAIRNSHVKVKGGTDGVDFDPERKRAAIFYRLRNMLGFPFLVYVLDADMIELFHYEAGGNFI
jgi:hypothetical protein